MAHTWSVYPQVISKHFPVNDFIWPPSYRICGWTPMALLARCRSLRSKPWWVDHLYVMYFTDVTMSSETRSLASRFVLLNSASFINTAAWLDGADAGCWEQSMWAACRESVRETQKKGGGERNSVRYAEAREVEQKLKRGWKQETRVCKSCCFGHIASLNGNQLAVEGGSRA